jgi:hypothetical protein
MSMFKIFGEEYFVDIDAIENYIQIPKKETSPLSGDTDDQTTISIVKYETIKLLIEIVMSETEPIDEIMAQKTNTELTLPFKIAFNSLLNKKIIRNY